MYTEWCQMPAKKVAACADAGWFKDFVDPQWMLEVTFKGSAISKSGGNNNMPQLNDPKIDAAMTKATGLQGQERLEAWGEIDKMITATAGRSRFVWDKTALIWSKDVKGVGNPYFTTIDFAFTSLKFVRRPVAAPAASGGRRAGACAGGRDRPSSLARVRFGIFYEHQLPRPGAPDGEHQLLQDALDQIELADRVGFDYVWEVEHHFLEEYSHSSAPEVFLAAASQRTTNIRLGLGILPLPPGYNHPARVAETRRDARPGLGRARRVRHGRDVDRRRARRLRRRPRRPSARSGTKASTPSRGCMVEEPFAGIDGRYVSMPPRNVVPKPLQKPHPPLWVACSRRETIRLAAEKGIGALSFAFIEPEEADEWVDEYYAIIASERLRPGRVRGQPERRRRAADDVPRRRGGGDRARHRRRALLRLLARALLRLRRPPARADEHLGGVPASAATRSASPASVIRAQDAPLGVQVLQAGARLAARRDRHARPGPRPAAARYEARGRRPGDLRAAGRAQPPRAHLRVARAVRRPRSCPSSPPTADAADAARDASSSGAIEAALRAARRRASPSAATRSRRPPPGRPPGRRSRRRSPRAAAAAARRAAAASRRTAASRRSVAFVRRRERRPPRAHRRVRAAA